MYALIMLIKVSLVEIWKEMLTLLDSSLSLMIELCFSNLTLRISVSMAREQELSPCLLAAKKRQKE